MQQLLVVNASARHHRSITRRLTSQFAATWLKANPDAHIVERDVGSHPPSPVNEAWIASAFANPAGRDSGMQSALTESEGLLQEIEEADAIVFGVPMYNFGLPAQLKAYFDQVIRVNRSFSFDAESDEPYGPLLKDKPVMIIISAGDGSLLPGGPMEHLNFLEPHLTTLLNFIGLNSIDFIRVGYEEFQDNRLKHSLVAAESTIQQRASEPA